MKSIISIICIFAFVGCSSGGNGDGAGGLNHKELADNFVAKLNADGTFAVTLVKKSTLQKNFIVVYDPDYDSYDAINISGYQPNGDAVTFYTDHAGSIYYDLDVIPGHYEAEKDYNFDCSCYVYDEVWVPTRYRDRHSDVWFEKTENTSKDLQTIAAFQQGAKIKKSADHIMAEFNLSESRSLEVARLAVQLNETPKGSMTNVDYDNFAKEILGHSITDYKEAIVKMNEGDKSKFNSLIDDAAKINGLSPEDVDRIINDVFPSAAMR